MRKKYIIRKFQLRIFARALFLVLIALFFAGLAIYLLMEGSVSTTLQNSRLVIKSTQKFILPIFAFASFITVFFVSGIGWILIYVFSHKVVGPIHRVKKHLEKVAGGDLSTKLFFRSSDDLHDVSENINDMTKSLAFKVDEVKQDMRRLHQVDQRFVELWRPKSQIDYKDLEDVIKELKEVEKSIDEKLNQFKS